MRFRRLELRGYRRFSEFKCAFGDGLNLIIGPNESGKSTLLGALLDALYVNPFSSAQELRERVSWGHSGGWELKLELRDGERSLCLYKRYAPDDPARRSECRFKGFEGKEALQHWEQFWGVPREVYLATACVRQRELSAIASDKKSLTSLQQQLRENALMTDLERVLKQIQEQLRELGKQKDALMAQRQSLAVQLQKAQEDASRQQEYRLHLQRLAEQIEQTQHQIEQEQAILERWQAVMAQHTELERVRGETERLRRALDALERIERDLQRLQGEIQHRGSYEQLRQTLQQQYEAVQREEQDVAEQLSQLEALGEQLASRRRLRGWIGVAGVALALLGASLIPMNGLLGGILAGLGLALLFIALLWRLSGAQAVERKRQQLQQQREHFQQQRQQAQARLRECEDLLSQHRVLLQAHDLDELRRQYNQLAAHQHALEAQLSGDPLAKQLLERSPEEWLQRQRQLEALQEKQERAKEEKLRLEGALHQLHLEHDPEELRLQLQQLDEQGAYLQRRIELLQTTRELLMEANRRYLSDLSPELQKRVAAYLPTLTCGRYTKVQMGDGLLFQVYHPDAGEWLDADLKESGWSVGTLDQIFFACRLGLLDVLTSDRRLPLLLDDPFLSFDEARLQAAMELLACVAQQTQVLLFTCRPPDPLPSDATLIDLSLSTRHSPLTTPYSPFAIRDD